MSGPGTKRRRTTGRRKRWAAFLTPRWLVPITILLVVLILALTVFLPSPGDDLEEALTRQGFTLNPGFAATFRPGDVLQIKEEDGRGGERPLDRPLLVLRREECFPGLTPKEEPFALPARLGRREGSFSLQGKRLARALPALSLEGRGAKSYSLAIENPRVATFAKTDLSERFAPACVSWFDRTLAAGDPAGWYATVIEAVVADTLDLTIEWETATKADARVRLTGAAKKGLPARGGTVATQLETSEKTVLRAEGPVVVGYRVRAMEPVLVEEGAS